MSKCNCYNDCFCKCERSKMSDEDFDNLNKDIDYIESILTSYNELGVDTEFYCRVYKWLHILKELEMERHIHVKRIDKENDKNNKNDKTEEETKESE